MERDHNLLRTIRERRTREVCVSLSHLGLDNFMFCYMDGVIEEPQRKDKYVGVRINGFKRLMLIERQFIHPDTCWVLGDCIRLPYQI